MIPVPAFLTRTPVDFLKRNDAGVWIVDVTLPYRKRLSGFSPTFECLRAVVRLRADVEQQWEGPEWGK